MVLESGGHVKAMAEDFAKSAHLPPVRRQPTALCRCSEEQMKVLLWVYNTLKKCRSLRPQSPDRPKKKGDLWQEMTALTVPLRGIAMWNRTKSQTRRPITKEKNPPQTTAIRISFRNGYRSL